MDSCEAIDNYFKNSCKIGLSYGYFREESKSTFAVKEQDAAKALSFCDSNGLSFTIKHRPRCLGGFVGKNTSNEARLRRK